MALKPLVEETEVEEALKLFAGNMSKGSVSLDTTIGWRGGNIKTNVLWNEKLRLWSCFEQEIADNRYWCAFGVEDPSKKTHLIITCEINFPKKGFNSKVAGLFVRDDSGNIYVTHSGNLRGGRKGISKSKFIPFVERDLFVDVTLEDGTEYERILIGRLEDPDLPTQVNNFVKRVYEFKEKAVSGEAMTPVPVSTKKFSPEFSGSREGYSVTGIIKSKCNHGIIVDELYNSVKEKGFEAANDFRDLYIYRDANPMTMLFEVKTDVCTSSIYTAIGQLNYYSAFYTPSPKLVMVLPSKPKKETKDILNHLGIEVMQYKLNKGTVIFYGLDSLLSTI